MLTASTGNVSPPADHLALLTADRALLTRLHGRALESYPVLAGRVSLERFTDAVTRSAAQRFGDELPARSDVARYLEALHVGDLALACACADGDEAVWEYFMTEWRPVLYRAARAIARDDDVGRELADSMYAELYGLGGTQSTDAGRRRSLFVYFHARSRLSTWLCAVLAQRHVDAVRFGRRFESLDRPAASSHDGRPGLVSSAATQPAVDPPDPDRARYVALMESAFATALQALDARDRLRLSCYYAQSMTLAQIGRLFGEHEATASRKLDRIRRRLRQTVERDLADRGRLTADEIVLSYQYAMDAGTIDMGMKETPVQEPAKPSFQGLEGST